MSISVVGLASVLGRFAAWEAVASGVGELTEEYVKDQVSNTAQGLVAVLTGETRASIAVTQEGVEASSAAPYLEFGTYKMLAQPFLEPAAESVDSGPIAALVSAEFGSA